MTSRSLWFRALSTPVPSRFAALAFVPALLVTSPARADECASDAECGLGFACETVVTSSVSTGMGGGAGTTGKGGAAGQAGAGAAAGAGVGGSAGSGVGGTTAYGGTSSFGGISGASGAGGVGGAPPVACGNGFCETPTESPETCAADCVYTTICAPAPCSFDLECAPGYYCPSPGNVGTGGGPNTAFCGDLLCVTGENATTCAVDCDPSYRRCRPGSRACMGDDDCGEGYTCSFSGGAPEPPVTGGSAGVGGGSAGYAGAATGGAAGTYGTGGAGAVPAGGASGIPQQGTCAPTGVTGGTGGVGGASGGTINTGANGPRGGNDGEGGTNGSDADNEGDVVITRGGCSLASATEHSQLALLMVALAALLRLGRRRGTR